MTPGVSGRYDTGRAKASRKPTTGLAGAKGLMTTEQFFSLLRRRRRDNAHLIDGRIESGGVRELTVLMSDSSGFSRKTNEYGILQFLAVMTQCYDRLIPLIEKRRGLCLSHNADNILAVFEKPVDAVAAAADMHRWLKRHNEGKDEAEQFNVCIGLHHGKMLRLKDNVFGACVNVAAKLGEDLAAKDEILVTREVADRIRGTYKPRYSRSTELGGRTLEVFTVPY
jgi:class 3 adenylate cyclase